MKRSLIFFLLATGGSIGALAGPGTPGKIRVNVLPGTKVETSFDVTYLTDNAAETGTTESVKVRRGVVVPPVERRLAPGSQIVLVWRTPFLVPAGETLEVSVTVPEAGYSANNVVGKINGKTNKANLPRFVDSIYRYQPEINSRELMDAWLLRNSNLLEEAMSAAGASAQDRGVLKAYESYLKIARRFAIAQQLPLKGDKLSEWYFEGFDIANPYFSKLADDMLVSSISRFWWEGRVLVDPGLKEEMKFVDLMRMAKSERLKQETAYGWVFNELRHKKFTPALKRLYPMFSTSLKPSRRTKAIDSLYKEYAIMDRGKPAYNFVMKDAAGKAIRLSDYKGKMVVLDFWADWCKGCIASLPDYKKIAAQYKDSSDIIFLSIAWQDEGTEELWKELSARHAIAGPTNMIIVKNEASKEYQRFFNSYKITGVPRYIAIDKEGNWLASQLVYPMDSMAGQIHDLYYEQKYE